MTPTKPTQESMAALLALAEKATKGPWCASVWYGNDGGFAAIGPHHRAGADEYEEYEEEPGSLTDQKAQADAAFIAAASPDVVLGYIAEIERLREFVASFRRWHPECAQLLDGWHQDGTAWTAWDESVRARLAELGTQAHALAEDR